MPTVVLRPNGTISILNQLTTITGGAGSAHASLADDSDSTYIGATGTFSDLLSEFDLTTFTLGTGRLKTVTSIVRARTSGSPKVLGALFVLGGVQYGNPAFDDITAAFANYSASPVALPSTATQAQIDGARGRIRSEIGIQNPEVAELSMSIVYATAPVVAVTYPTTALEITGTNSPTIDWSYTQGTDGGAQSRYQVKVFTAAQIAAGGFSADTSESVYDSGEVVSSATSHTVDPLASPTSYGVYVRAAQTINGVPHWSAWDSETFSIAVATADISTVVGVATDADAKITVTVTRDGTSEAWNAAEVERQVGSGPWEPVRGATNVDATGHATSFVVVDYEVPNNVATKYRARATRILSGAPITGAFVESTAVQWEHADAWLKDPSDPTKNLAVKIRELSQADTPIRQGVHEVLGRARPVVISDVRVSDRGSFVVQTATMAAARSLVDLLDAPFLLLQFPPDWDVVSSRYVATAMIGRARLEQRAGNEYQLHPIGYHEIDAPSDPTAGTGLP